MWCCPLNTNSNNTNMTAAAAVVTAATYENTAPLCLRPTEAKCVRVYDGDTIWLAFEHAGEVIDAARVFWGSTRRKFAPGTKSKKKRPWGRAMNFATSSWVKCSACAPPIRWTSMDVCLQMCGFWTPKRMNHLLIHKSSRGGVSLMPADTKSACLGARSHEPGLHRCDLRILIRSS